MNRTLAAASLAAIALLAGCASSPWERNYDGVRLSDSATAGDVVVREVPWERLESVRTELKDTIVKSDIHPDEWTTPQREQFKATLLRGLQVSEAPSNVEILGRSEFKSTENVKPNGGALVAWAKKVGANRVVWTRRGLGKVTTVTREPVWTFTSGADYFRNDTDGRRRTVTYSESTTTWVPVVVQADETAWVAYFLRVPPGK